MARKPVPKYVPLEQRPAFLAAVQALPVDPAELEALARQARQVYNDAVLAGDAEQLDAAHDAYMAIVVRLNGDSPAGCGPVIGALDKALSAAPGHVPGWGQAGHFLLEVDGLRFQVVARSGTLENHCIHDLIAVDLDKPFPNESGFKSLHMTVIHHLGETFDQAVRRAVRGLLELEGQMVSIGADAKLLPSLAKRPRWLADALAGVKPDGQLAMFGDVPPVKAPLTNAQRQKALRERRKQQQLKPVMMTEAERQLLEKIREQFEGAPGIGNVRPLKGTYGYANGDFTMFNVGDVDLIAVWKSSRTDFFKAAVALGTLTLRNRQHAELGHAVEVLQARLRAAGLSDQVSDDKQPWYWNKCPPRDYRPMSAPEYMERLGQIPTLADELTEANRMVDYTKEELERLKVDLRQSFENNYVLRQRLRDAGLSVDLP